MYTYACIAEAFDMPLHLWIVFVLLTWRIEPNWPFCCWLLHDFGECALASFGRTDTCTTFFENAIWKVTRSHRFIFLSLIKNACTNTFL